MAFSPITNFRATLAAPMTASQLTLTVDSVTVQDHAIVTADYGGVLYFTINPGAANMEIVKAESNASTVFTLTSRGLAFYGATETELASFKFPHNAGEPVIVSNPKDLYKSFVDKYSDESVNGVKTFDELPKIPLSPVDPEDAASKDYVDNAVIAVGGVTDLMVSKNGADPTLTINVASGYYTVGDVTALYAGASAQAVTDAATNYIMLRSDGTLTINTTGFLDGYLQIAIVVASGGTITSVSDRRSFLTLGQDNQIITTSLTYGATLAVGDPVYVDASASNKLKKALGTGASTADGFVGVVLEAGADTATGLRVQVGGVVSGLSGLTSNAPVYITDAGGFASTQGTYKKAAGWALSASAFLMMPGLRVEEISGGNSDATTANFNEAMTFFANTNITGAEAETLTAGPSSDATALHKHIVSPLSFTVGTTLVAPGSGIEYQITSDPSGDNVYVFYASGSTPNINKSIMRFERNSATGMYEYLDDSVSLPESTYSWDQDGDGGICAGENYVYLMARSDDPTSNAARLLRMDKDFGNVTAMTLSGSDITNAVGCIAGDDDQIFVAQNAATTTYAQYTISGTTATRGSNITIASTDGEDVVAFLFDGTDLLMIESDTEGIRRINTSGTNQATRNVTFFPNSGPARASLGAKGLGFYPNSLTNGIYEFGLVEITTPSGNILMIANLTQYS